MTRPSHDEVLAALTAGNARWACHLTYARNLPDIAASGGLLSSALRTTPSAHSWGANRSATEDRVCLSLMVSWPMIRHKMNGQELAVLVVDTARLPDLAQLWVTPYNSASRDATPFLTDATDLLAAIAEATADRQSRARAELLVPDEIPLAAVRGMVICDQQALDTWTPPFLAALPDQAEPPQIQLPRPGGWWRFPEDFAVAKRDLPTSPGRDLWALGVHSQEAGEGATDLEDEPHWMDFEEWDEPEEDEGPPSWSDFYDDGEPDDPDWYELSVRD